MKCVFCAEEIQPEATLCRFCGSVKKDGIWIPPPPGSGAGVRSARKGRFTIRFAGLFFLVSGVLELLCLTAAVPLFGAVRTGALAVTYHLLYTAFYLATGVGLLIGSYWVCPLVFGGTLFYTLDKVIYALDRKTVEVHVKSMVKGYPEVLDMLDMDSLLDMTVTTTLLFVACWWVFAIYIYLRRATFRA